MEYFLSVFGCLVSPVRSGSRPVSLVGDVGGVIDFGMQCYHGYVSRVLARVV